MLTQEAINRRLEAIDFAKGLVDQGWATQSWGYALNGQALSASEAREYYDKGELAMACAHTALAIAEAKRGEFGLVVLGNAIVRREHPGHDVPSFNDSKGRTKADILALFDKIKDEALAQMANTVLTEAIDKRIAETV